MRRSRSEKGHVYKEFQAACDLAALRLGLTTLSKLPWRGDVTSPSTHPKVGQRIARDYPHLCKLGLPCK